MNYSIIIGNLTKKPEMIDEQNFARLVVAVNDTFTKKDGTTKFSSEIVAMEVEFLNNNKQNEDWEPVDDSDMPF